jgi:hypothetical protein
MARPRGALNKSTEKVRRLASRYAPAAIKELARLSLGAENETARVAACKEILDRAYGKSTQPISGEDGGALVVKIVA